MKRRGERRSAFSDLFHVIVVIFAIPQFRGVEVTEKTRGARAALHLARPSRRTRCRDFCARADARGRSPRRHARDGRDRREVRRRARAAMRFFAPPALSIWRHDALFDPSNAPTEPRVGANAPPATAHKSDLRCLIPVFAKSQMRAHGARRLPSRTRRTSPGGCVPRRSRQQYPRKPRTNCLCRDFPQTTLASSRRVTLRHTARPPSRSIPLTRDFPRIHPTTRPTGLRAPSSVSRRNRARAVAVRATYTGASRARSRSSFRRSRRFFRSDVRFLETATHTLALLISRIFFLATKEPLFSSLFPFFPKAKKTSDSPASDGEAHVPMTNDMSALTLFTRCRLFLFRLPRTTTT